MLCQTDSPRTLHGFASEDGPLAPVSTVSCEQPALELFQRCLSLGMASPSSWREKQYFPSENSLFLSMFLQHVRSLKAVSLSLPQTISI